MKAKVNIGYHKRNIKMFLRNRSGLSIMEAPLSSFLKKLISVELQNRKEYQRQQEEGYLREEGKKAM